MVIDKLPVHEVLHIPSEILEAGDFILLVPGITEEKFWEITDEDSNYELIDAVLVIHSPASTDHETIFRDLMTIFNIYLEKTQEGQVFGSRLVMRLSEGWNPEPDLMIVTPDRHDLIKNARLEGPADLVIEILSKSTRELDLTKKLPRYLDAGVREVWLIDPAKKEIFLYTKSGKNQYLDSTSSEEIHSTVLPSLLLQVRWLWNREAFPLKEILKQIS